MTTPETRSLKIKNAKDLFFKNDKHFYDFKDAWSAAMQSPERKKTFVETYYGKILQPGILTAAHHLLYGLLRGTEPYNGFTPTKKRTKLANGTSYTHGIYYAMENLHSIFRWAKQIKDNPNPPHNLGYHSWVDEFLKPFNDTVTIDMLLKCEELVDKVPLIFASYGVGRLIFIRQDYKPISYREMWNCYLEVA